MQTISDKQPSGNFRIRDLPPDDKNNIVGAFAWLIKQDKKQNPSLYKINTNQNND